MFFDENRGALLRLSFVHRRRKRRADSRGIEHFQFETPCVSNHTACRFAGKRRFCFSKGKNALWFRSIRSPGRLRKQRRELLSEAARFMTARMTTGGGRLMTKRWQYCLAVNRQPTKNMGKGSTPDKKRIPICFAHRYPSENRIWRPQGDLNPCRRRERPLQWDLPSLINFDKVLFFN